MDSFSNDDPPKTSRRRRVNLAWPSGKPLFKKKEKQEDKDKMEIESEVPWQEVPENKVPDWR